MKNTSRVCGGARRRQHDLNVKDEARNPWVHDVVEKKLLELNFVVHGPATRSIGPTASWRAKRAVPGVTAPRHL